MLTNCINLLLFPLQPVGQTSLYLKAKMPDKIPVFCASSGRELGFLTNSSQENDVCGVPFFQE